MTLSKYALKKALQYNSRELKLFLIITIFSGFILSFRKWGTTTFNVTEGIYNLILYTTYFIITYIIFLTGQKFIANKLGYYAEFDLWQFGPAIGLLITFMTYGFLPFLYLGNINVKTHAKHRIGEFQHSINMKELLVIGLTGPITLLLVMLLIFHPLYMITGSIVFEGLIKTASIIFIFSSIPLPKSNGMNIIIKSKTAWLIFFLFSLLTFLLLQFLIITPIYVLALVLAILFAWLLKKYAFNKIL